MTTPPPPPNPSAPDVRERGAARDGVPQWLNRRLFFELIALEAPRRPGPDAIAEQLSRSLDGQAFGAVVYADLHHPLRIAVVAFSEDPQALSGPLRRILGSVDLPEDLRIVPEYAMLGRTYSTGFEQDLEFWLLERPRKTLLNPNYDFAIWYPLRRKGPFERLEPKQKSAVMQEHGAIGRAYGESDLAHDIRLACHGLDPNDNDFVVGLLGKDLHPLSHVVQAMRKTVQTAEYMEKMGPFFVGRALYRIAGR